ncbi:MAG TPA: hypothetical protein VN851_23275 [Thermoanaerobaculia bacterium]|nr:hypothetical protein [Thermoanaerobaculia bacterium]
MAFTFILNIHGLCFYVPEDDGKAMRVLLVDPPTPSASSSGAGDHHEADHSAAPLLTHQHDVHLPLLVVNELDIDPDSMRMPDFQYSDGNRQGAFYLRNLQFGLGSTEKKLDIDERPTGTCPLPGNLSSFNWVVPLDRVDPSLGHLDPRCLSQDLDQIHPTVAARVSLREGKLRTSTFASARSRPSTIWEFVPSSGGSPSHRQAVADVVQFEIYVADDDLVINFEPLRPDASTLPLTISPRDDETEVTASLLCMPIEDVLGLRPAEELIPGQQRPRDLHFSHFFDLFGPGHANQHPYIPRVALQSCTPTAIPPTLSSIHCPGGRVSRSHLGH